MMLVHRCPAFLSSTPTLEAVTPLPRPLTTPPVTRTYFMSFLVVCDMPRRRVCGVGGVRTRTTRHRAPHGAAWQRLALLRAASGLGGVRSVQRVKVNGGRRDWGRTCR